ncbi:tRNA-dihydrouridine synthase [Pseudomonas syringae pv. antirrhini]|nr:tRNA-dihydrouridine synthase [Pseudomonas syringae pv. antirrhini]
MRNCSDFIQFSLYPVIESGYHANPFSNSRFALAVALAAGRTGRCRPGETVFTWPADDLASTTGKAMSAVRIGPYTVHNGLILAPMAGVTDQPFRQLCRQLGAGLVVSEMVTSDMSLWNSRKSRLRMIHAGDPEPRSVQIAGGDAQMMADAARANVELGAQIIDINMGCPAKKVCNKAAGSALLKDEQLVNDILQAVVAAVDVPVTLKIRTGWDRDNRNGLTVAKIAEQAGIQALAVHGRTRADLYTGEAEYDTIAMIKQAVSIPVFANGDIDSPEKARHVLQATGADGLLIGRAAQGRPWIFREIEHYLLTGKTLPALQSSEVERILLEHLAALHVFYGDVMGVRIARKHVGWYLATLPGAREFRALFNRLEDTEAQCANVREFFSQGCKGPDNQNDKEVAA